MPRKTRALAVALDIDRTKPEFKQAQAAHYACNGSGAISGRSIRRATENGELHPVKIGHAWLYSRADIDAWLASKGGAR